MWMTGTSDAASSSAKFLCIRFVQSPMTSAPPATHPRAAAAIKAPDAAQSPVSWHSRISAKFSD